MKIELVGSFRLSDEEGTEIVLPGKLSAALIAILATSKHHKRSREVLKAMLWPRSPSEQSAASLRTLLSSLRGRLGSCAQSLDSDNRSVQLRNVTVEEPKGSNQEFFEDAPSIGEAFEDWLSTERARVRQIIRPVDTVGGRTSSRRLCIAIYPPEIKSDEKHANHVAIRIINQMRQHLCLMDMADVLDMSIQDSTGLSTPILVGQRTPEVALLVSLSKAGSFAEVGIRAIEPISKRLLWSASISADQSTTFLFSNDQLDEFVNQAVDSINGAFLRLMETGQVGKGLPPKSMFGAVHQVLGMSVQGQRVARSYFRDKANLERSSIAAAWYAFSLANTLGEAGDRQHIADEAGAYCRRAVELDPSNALTLALVGHVQSFVLRRFDVGAEFAQMARQIAPTLAIGWDLSAMNALYRGDIGEAVTFSKTAVRLGRFSPYKPFFESSRMISASLNGDHDEAIQIAGRVLDRIPNFLAVERHLSGSLAAMNRHAENRVLLNSIRTRDTRFFSENLDDPDYPLPSPQSIDLIRRGLLLTELAN